MKRTSFISLLAITIIILCFDNANAATVSIIKHIGLTKNRSVIAKQSSNEGIVANQSSSQRLFDALFEDISLTTAQEQVAVAATQRYEKAFHREDRAERTREEIDQEFINELEGVLDTQQIAQVRENIAQIKAEGARAVAIADGLAKLAPIYLKQHIYNQLFDNVELTSSQKPFVRAEIDSFYQRVQQYALTEGGGQPVVQMSKTVSQAYMEEFLQRLSAKLSPEQIRQIRENHEGNLAETE